MRLPDAYPDATCPGMKDQFSGMATGIVIGAGIGGVFVAGGKE